ncbi:hypothetical protein NN561_010774 [Cricetulus griseus]
MEIRRHSVWLFRLHPTPSSVMVIASILGYIREGALTSRSWLLGSSRKWQACEGVPKRSTWVKVPLKNGSGDSTPTSPSDFRKAPSVKFKLFVSHKISCGIIMIVSFTKKYINSSETQLGLL